MKTLFHLMTKACGSSIAIALLIAFSFGTARTWAQTPFSPNNLSILVAAANNLNNTTVSVVEINKTDTNQLAIQTIPIPDTGTDAIRVSGSATSTLYASNSNDGTLFCFTGHNATTTGVNANTILPRGVVTLNHAGIITLQTTYTGNSGSQTRCATTLNNVDFYIADQAGQYTNGATLPSPAGNFRGMKAFGGQVYVGAASSVVTTIEVSTTSDLTGGTITGLPGITNNGTHTDFYLVSSGTHGTDFDLLYITRASSATAGTIAKYSLDSGMWVANGTYTTNFGGFNIAAEKDGIGARLYITTGNGATSGNMVRCLIDSAGHNVPLTIIENYILHTTATGTTIKGIAFAPKAPQVITPVITLMDNGTQIAPGNVYQGELNTILSTFIINVGVASDTLNAISFPAAGNFSVGDIAGFHLFTNSTNAFPSGNPLATVPATALANGNTVTFNNLMLPCNIGNQYFWITADISLAAIPLNTVSVPALDSTHFTFFGSTANGQISAAGAQTIQSNTPVVTVTPLSPLVFNNYPVGTVSPAKSYSLTGVNLTSNLMVLSAPGFQISDTPSGPFTDSILSLVPVAGSVNATIYVRFAPAAAQTYQDSIANQANNAIPVFVHVSGKGLLANNQTLVHYWNFNNNATLADLLTPNVALVSGGSISHITGGTSNINFTGGSGQNFDVENLNARLSDPSGTHLRFDNPIGGELRFDLPTTGFEKPAVRFTTRRSGSGAGLQYWSYTLDTSGTFVPFDTIVTYDANPILHMFDFSTIPAADDNPHFALKVSFAQGAGGTVGNNRFDNFTLDADPLTVIPMVNASVSSLPAFLQTIGTPSAEASFTVSGSGLTNDISVTVPAPFEVSLTSGAGFTGSVTIPQVAGSVTDTTIWVRLNSLTLGNFTDDITVSSTGAASAQIAVSGTCQNIPVPTVLFYYWHFNNLNTSAGDVKVINADYSIFPSDTGVMTYTGGQPGDRDIDEYTPGSTINLQMGELEGKAARVRNPSDNRSLVFDLSTSQCMDIIFEYAVHRSSSGMLNHEIDYSVDGINFIQTGLAQTSYSISEVYQLISIDFTGITAVNNNPNFKIRIQFVGNTIAANGNNRFDNITLRGSTVVDVPEIVIDGNKSLLAYPNPVTGKTVNFNKEISFHIFDSYGRMVASAEKVTQFDVNNLKPGLYFIKEYMGETIRIIIP